MIRNPLSVVYYSSTLNNESIDKPTGIIREINETDIIVPNFLEMNLVRGSPRRATKRPTWTSVRIRRAISAAKPKPGTVDPADRRVVNTIAEVAITFSTEPEVGPQTFGVEVSDMPPNDE